MNKNFKIFIYIMLSFFIAGCTKIDYEVYINEDFTFDEVATIYIDDFEADVDDISEFLMSTGMKNKFGFNYDYNLDFIDDEYIFNVKKTSNDMEELLRSSINTNSLMYLSYYVDTDEYLKIISEQPNFDRYSKINKLFYNENIRINVVIKSHYKIIDSNADKVDFKNNVFTWSFDKNSKNKFISIKVDKKEVFDKYGVKDYIYYYYNKYKGLIITLLIITIISTIPFFIIKRFRENSEI